MVCVGGLPIVFLQPKLVRKELPAARAPPMIGFEVIIELPASIEVFIAILAVIVSWALDPMLFKPQPR